MHTLIGSVGLSTWQYPLKPLPSDFCTGQESNPRPSGSAQRSCDSPPGWMVTTTPSLPFISYLALTLTINFLIFFWLHITLTISVSHDLTIGTLHDHGHVT